MFLSLYKGNSEEKQKSSFSFDQVETNLPILIDKNKYKKTKLNFEFSFWRLLQIEEEKKYSFGPCDFFKRKTAPRALAAKFGHLLDLDLIGCIVLSTIESTLLVYCCFSKQDFLKIEQ